MKPEDILLLEMMGHLVETGEFEVRIGEDGEPRYRITELGRARAAQRLEDDRWVDDSLRDRDRLLSGSGRSRPRWPAPLVEPGAVFAHLLALRRRRVALAG